MDGPNYVRDGGEELGVVLEEVGSYAVWKLVEAPQVGSSWKLQTLEAVGSASNWSKTTSKTSFTSLTSETSQTSLTFSHIPPACQTRILYCPTESFMNTTV